MLGENLSLSVSHTSNVGMNSHAPGMLSPPLSAGLINGNMLTRSWENPASKQAPNQKSNFMQRGVEMQIPPWLK